MQLFDLDDDAIGSASPFLIWVGGKRLLLPEIHSRLPQQYNNYIEPFLGGGSVFFSVNPENAFLSDKNLELINTYNQVKYYCDRVHSYVEEMAYKYIKDKDYYFTARDEFNNTPKDTIRSAALMIFLNRTGFNGLYRKNKQGKYNVPIGSAKTFDLILRTEDLYDCSIMLKRAKSITYRDYTETVMEAEKGDFVYLDPPYDDTYNGYIGESFNQEELFDVCQDLNAKGIKFIQSNSKTDKISKLYKDYVIDTVSTNHMIRLNTEEVMIKNF